MEIQFKQAEIISALKQYIVQQGIDIKGKTFSVDFTAGRKNTGISAAVTIEDSGVPPFDLESDDQKNEKPALAVVKTSAVDITDSTDSVAAPQESPSKTTSLFS